MRGFLSFKNLMKVEKERSSLLKTFFRQLDKAKGSRLKDKGFF
jgi:hypothetical protein